MLEVKKNAFMYFVMFLLTLMFGAVIKGVCYSIFLILPYALIAITIVHLCKHIFIVLNIKFDLF